MNVNPILTFQMTVSETLDINSILTMQVTFSETSDINSILALQVTLSETLNVSFLKQLITQEDFIAFNHHECLIYIF
jgi:hypothetical protein